MKIPVPLEPARALNLSSSVATSPGLTDRPYTPAAAHRLLNLNAVLYRMLLKLRVFGILHTITIEHSPLVCSSWSSSIGHVVTVTFIYSTVHAAGPAHYFNVGEGDAIDDRFLKFFNVPLAIM